MALGKLGSRGGMGRLGSLGRAGSGGSAPTITGTPKVGQTLTASQSSTWSVGGVSQSFLSPSTTYVPVPQDVGKTVTASAGGPSSTPTAAVVNADLPAVSPSLAYGALVAILGDSIVQGNSQGAARSGDATQGGSISRALGEISQVLTFDPRFNGVNWYDSTKTTGGTLRLTDGSNQGISGQSSTQIAARVSDIVARNPGVCIIAAGTNNASQPATVLSDIQGMVSTLRAAGIRVIVGTIRPNTLANESPSRARADIQTINSSIRSYVAGLGDAGVVVWDAYKQYDRGDGYMEPLDTYDRLLHPNDAGSELGAWGNGATMAPDSLAFAISRLVQSGNVYNDIMTANANVLANPTLTGTAGAVAAPITGTAPSSSRWEPQGTMVSTGVASVRTNPYGSGGQSTDLIITPSGTAAFERANFRLSGFTQNIASLGGKWARIYADVETDGTWWLMAPSVNLVSVETATPFQAGIGFQANTSPGTGNFISGIRPIARRRLIMSEPVLLGAACTGLSPSVQFAWMPNGPLGLASGTAKVTVNRWWMATVPNPKTAWNQ